MTVIQSQKPFILKIPVVVLAKGTYAWLPMVALYNWPPILSGLLAGYICLNLGLLFIQQNTWRRLIQEGKLGTGAFLYTEKFKPPVRDMWVHTTASVLGGVFAWYLLQGTLGLTGLQWFLLIGGYFLLEQVIHLIVFPPQYLMTEDGVWILTTHTSGFVWFGEVKAVHIVRGVQLPRATSAVLTPITAATAVQLLPVKPRGFSEFSSFAVLFLNDVKRFSKFFPPQLVQAADKIIDAP